MLSLIGSFGQIFYKKTLYNSSRGQKSRLNVAKILTASKRHHDTYSYQVTHNYVNFYPLIFQLLRNHTNTDGQNRKQYSAPPLCWISGYYRMRYCCQVRPANPTHWGREPTCLALIVYTCHCQFCCYYFAQICPRVASTRESGSVEKSKTLFFPKRKLRFPAHQISWVSE